MSTQIQIRRDTAAAWTAANPVLADGELGYETDSGTLKIGDGVTAWSTLPEFAGGGGGGAALLETSLRLVTAVSLDNGVWTDVPWDTEDVDTAGAWSSGASLVVPAGITRARITAAIAWDNASAGARYLRAYNATTDVTYGGDIRFAQNEAFQTLTTPWVSVAAGNSIRLRALQNRGSALLLQGAGFGGPSRITVEWKE